MKYITVIMVCFLSIYSQAAQGPSSESLLAIQSATGMGEFTNKVFEEKISPSTTDCPSSGTKIIAGENKVSGGLMNAKKYLQTVGTSAQAQASNLKTTNMCGSCQQTIEATPFVITQPGKVKYDQTCENRPTMSFQADFQSDKEAEDFSQAVLNKKNQEGQRLYAGCPDPCAFTVYAGKRVLENGKVRSVMTVNCGQPRNSSILFAKYNFTYGTAIRWTCTK